MLEDMTLVPDESCQMRQRECWAWRKDALGGGVVTFRVISSMESGFS